MDIDDYSTLSENVAELQTLVGDYRAGKEVNGDRVDDLTGNIHSLVWEECPGEEYVRKKIIPLFNRSAIILKELIENGRGSRFTQSDVKKIECRVANIERYAEGLLSRMMTDEEEREIQDLVGSV